MQTVSARFVEAIRHPHTMVTKAVHRNPTSGALTALSVEDGSVAVDVQSNVRRQLTISLPPEQTVWDLLDVAGAEITVTQWIRYVDGQRESVPVGVFIVDADSIGYAPGDTLQLTCPDRWLRVQRNNFGVARASVPGNTAWQEIQRLVEAPWGASFPGWAQLDTTATTKVGIQLWDDGNREAAILQLCSDNSLEVFFDATGKAVLRPVPALSNTSVPVWSVDAGATGVLMTADRSRDRSSLHNSIIVTTSATDVTFPPQEVQNTTAGDPLNTTGELGKVPLEYSSPTLRNSAQARAAGKTILSRNLGVAKQLSMTAAPNPALDVEDVIRVVLPQIDRNTPRPTELHMLDSVTIPLTPGGTQDMQTRSTRPDTDGT